MLLGKWKSRWLFPFIVHRMFAYGAVELHDSGDSQTFIGKGKRHKIYSRDETPVEKVSLTTAEP